MGVDEIQQPQQKVHEWLNDRNHGVFGEAKAFGDVEHHSKLW